MYKLILTRPDRKITFACFAGKRKSRKLEKRLRRKEKRQERKIIRAMDVFGRQVTSIAKKMGYLPGTL